MNHSPRPRREAPNQEDMKTPTKKMKVMEVMNPRPAGWPNYPNGNNLNQVERREVLNSMTIFTKDELIRKHSFDSWFSTNEDAGENSIKLIWSQIKNHFWDSEMI